MRDIIFATESNADLTEQYIKDNNILVIPHYYSLDDDVYGEDKFLTNKEFYDGMAAGKKSGTMASNPAVILDEFGAAAKEGKDIIFISFSSALSSGYQNICNGANEIMEENPGMKITVIDTLSASVNEQTLIVKGLQLKAEGKTFEEIEAELRALVPSLCAIFTVDDLEYLYRGGRLSKTSAVLGSMIGIKPILHINDEGKLIPANKVRGRKKSLKTMVEMVNAQMGSFKGKQVHIGLIHADCIEDAEYVKGLLKETITEEISIVELGPSIGAHSGPGTLGIMFLGDVR